MTRRGLHATPRLSRRRAAARDQLPELAVTLSQRCQQAEVGGEGLPCRDGGADAGGNADHSRTASGSQRLLLAGRAGAGGGGGLLDRRLLAGNRLVERLKGRAQGHDLRLQSRGVGLGGSRLAFEGLQLAPHFVDCGVRGDLLLGRRAVGWGGGRRSDRAQAFVQIVEAGSKLALGGIQGGRVDDRRGLRCDRCRGAGWGADGPRHKVRASCGQ